MLDPGYGRDNDNDNDNSVPALRGGASSPDMMDVNSIDLTPSDIPISLGAESLNQILTYNNGPCNEKFRDICAVVDFLACSSMDLFIGNSVSTWSALQIAQRLGMATWYNSRSIPLANLLQAFVIPIVYTYTEDSATTGKYMLIAR